MCRYLRLVPPSTCTRYWPTTERRENERVERRRGAMVRVCEGTHCHPVSHLVFPVTCATSKHPNLRGELSNFRQQTARHAQGAINLSETASSQPHTPHPTLTTYTRCPSTDIYSFLTRRQALGGYSCPTRKYRPDTRGGQLTV